MLSDVRAALSRALVAILIAFVGLGLIYAIIDPVFEASDEMNHYPFVKHLAAGNGLPVQQPGVKTLWEQEGSQPPLYYALAAVATFWIDTSDLPDVLYKNPHAMIGVPLARDNKNMFIHTGREAFPWRGTVLAVRLIRFLSVGLGTLTVYLTYLLALTIFPGNGPLALLAAALVAFNPMFLFISGSVNNDNLIVTLSALGLWLMVRLVQGRATTRTLVGLSIVIGLASLSKLSGLLLLPLALLAISMTKSQKSPWPSVIFDWLLVIGQWSLIAGWWYIRNWQLYGDPLGLNVMLDIANASASLGPRPDLIGLLNEFQGFRISFWGLFGGVNVLLDPTWLYTLFDALTLVALIGLVVWVRRACSAPLLLLVAWIALVTAGLIRWTLQTAASQGRLLFPALPALAVLFALGLTSLVPERRRRLVAGGLAVGLGLVAATTPFRSIIPAYARPVILTLADIPADLQPVDITYGSAMRLLGYQVQPAVVPPGGSINVTLYWQALVPMTRDYSIYLHLFGRGGQRIGKRDSYPGRGTYPTRLWQPGDVVRDTFEVPVAPDAVTPTAALLEVGLYDLPSMQNLPAQDAAGQPLGRPILGRVKIAGQPQPPPPALPGSNLTATGTVIFGEMVRLMDYELQPITAHSGDAVRVTFDWEVIAQPDRDYTIFIHLSGPDGRPLSQGDGPPLDGDYPTSFWSPGEHLRDTHTLTIASAVPPGRYPVMAGFYLLESGVRLPASTPAGAPVGDHVVLGTIQVEQAK